MTDEALATKPIRKRRESKRLAPRAADTITKAGRHADGNGLYLVVDVNGARRWVFIFRWRRSGEKGPGRLREMGLGPAGSDKVTLADARDAVAEARRQVIARVDPIAERKKAREVPTFGSLADEVVKARTSALRHQKSVDRWKRSLSVYAEPLRELAVDAVEANDVYTLLEPIWTTKPETAKFVRAAIEAVLDAAKSRGFRTGDNPARWRGHLQHSLTRPAKLSRGHHAAMPYAAVPVFVAELRERDAVAARALEFVILTAARAGEAREARWSEVDLAAKLWTIPAERMKAGREHRVPLSARAVQILEEMAKAKTNDFVFPGQRRGKVVRADAALSTSAFDGVLVRMKRDVTTHGFRSSFRDWVAEVSTFPGDLAEAALAHTVGDATERAYRRGDALEKRRKLMEAWASYCEPRSGSNVRQFGRRVSA
ncbi:MAG TPA: tyrosine-type recombinase/integrase [Caulobacteraceae bacterium]|nr:tyrosine-type recombinase/integrase [Caulobacteraceae bacterium]